MTMSRSMVAALLASTMLASPAIAANLCQKKSRAMFVRESCKRKEIAVDLATIGVQGAIRGSCPSGQVLQGVNDDGTVACVIALPDGAVTSAAIEDVTRTLSFPARALAFDPGNFGLEFDGIRWADLGVLAARLIIPRIADWDGVSDVRFRILFYPTTATPGTVQYFMRPRVYDPGDTFEDTTGVESETVAVGIADQYNELRITIPAARFGTKAWWYLVLQRSSADAGRYPDDLVITSIAIDYTGVR